MKVKQMKKTKERWAGHVLQEKIPSASYLLSTLISRQWYCKYLVYVHMHIVYTYKFLVYVSVFILA